jgi:oligopeptide transport system substrate-binding protein
MRVPARKGGIVAAVGLALVVSACGGGDDGDNDGGGSASSGGAVSIRGCNPQNPLVPALTQEVCGGDPLDAVFSKLVRYDAETAAPENEIAASIESEDNQTWTITLEDGWTFHDGTPITAESFVNAWNWGAYGPNAALNSYFYDPIEGFAEVNGEVDDEGTYVDGSATAEAMSGLAVVDDLTFTVRLTSPQSSFPQRLGYIAFAPLPEVFYTDVDAFGNRPIGSGPFELVEWNPEVDIQLTAYDGYQGEVKPQVQDVTFKLYAQDEAAYADLLADNVDVMPQLPASSLTGEQYKSDLGDRYVEREAGLFQSITFAPESVDPAMDNPNLRKAISMAIERDLIVRNIFQGTRAPATGWVSPVVDGYTPDQCGEWCTYDPDRARELLAESGFTGELTLTTNGDADHQTWTQAVCNSISNALEIECTALTVPLFSTYRDQITEREMTGMFRTGWQMDYPSIENFLAPLYATGAGANDGDYSNPAFDDLIAQAAQAADADQAIALYQDAERLLAEDMPAIPLWYETRIAGYSSRVENVQISAFGTTDLLSLSLS